MALLAVLGLMLSGSVAYAETQDQGQALENPGKGRFQKCEGKFFKDLGLTAEQKEKLKAQRESRKEASCALRDQMKTKMKVLHESLGQSTVDKAQLNTLVAEINMLKGQLFSQRIDGILAMKEVLTPEQFAKMQARFAEKRGKHGKHGQCKWGKGKYQDGEGVTTGASSGESSSEMKP